jgi:tetratricopeptide (TPR) repeat protein
MPTQRVISKRHRIYDAAIRLKPEFPEAEFQRALALLFSNQKEEALKGFNRAVELRPDWAYAYAVSDRSVRVLQ